MFTTIEQSKFIAQMHADECRTELTRTQDAARAAAKKGDAGTQWKELKRAEELQARLFWLERLVPDEGPW